jgi:hypothetical protein
MGISGILKGTKKEVADSLHAGSGHGCKSTLS